MTTSGAGVEVAPGDPGQLFQAAQFHSELADSLSAHGSTIAGAAESVSPSWTGEAAASYQALSGIVAAHFWHASGISRAAAATLRRYATELARLQREGLQALHEAEHWLGEVHTWTERLREANDAVTRAQGALRVAQMAYSDAAANPHGTAVSSAASAVTRAQGELTQAEGVQRRAQHALEDAQHLLTHWQRRGAELWGEAQTAAIRATGELEPLNVAPPPMPGAPFAGLPGVAPPPATENPYYRWLEAPPIPPNKAVADPNPRHHHCDWPFQLYLPYFGCKSSPPKQVFRPPPPPPSHPAPSCANGVNLPLVGCVQPPSLPSLPSLPPLPPLPPIPLPA